MRSVEGLDRHHRSGERSFLRDVEILRHRCLLLRIDVEPVLGTVRLDIPVALRGDGPGSRHRQRVQPPAISSGKLIDRAEGSLARGGQFG